jgi:hypothetical protein
LIWWCRRHLGPRLNSLVGPAPFAGSCATPWSISQPLRFTGGRPPQPPRAPDDDVVSAVPRGPPGVPSDRESAQSAHAQGRPPSWPLSPCFRHRNYAALPCAMRFTDALGKASNKPGRPPVERVRPRKYSPGSRRPVGPRVLIFGVRCQIAGPCFDSDNRRGRHVMTTNGSAPWVKVGRAVRRLCVGSQRALRRVSRCSWVPPGRCRHSCSECWH